MGCSSSTKACQADAESQDDLQLRRRLSIGNTEGGDDVPLVKVRDEDRTLLSQLQTKSILDFLPDGGGLEDLASAARSSQSIGRRFSLGTIQLDGSQQQNSFQSKNVSLEGDQKFMFDSAKEMVGYACKKGLKPEAPNQDSFCILRFSTYALYGVFDGHGRNGHDVSNFVKENLPKILLSQENYETEPEKALLSAFEKMQSLIATATAMQIIDAARSGTTCSVVLHCLEKNNLYIAHVGDSRVVLGREPKKNESPGQKALDLTIDHKPDLPAERKRIEQAGGVVIFDGGWNYRVFAKDKKDSRGKRYPGLNMSRAMGDLNGFNDAGISAVPEVNTHQVDASKPKEQAEVPGIAAGDSLLREAAANNDAAATSQTSERVVSSTSTPSVSSHDLKPSDKFLLAASDGVWEFISSEEAVEEVLQFKPTQAAKAAEHLAALAWDRWMLQMEGQVVDDITVLVVYF